MSDNIKVRVLRTQIGDKRYERGDTRELPKDVAERFAANGAVEIVEGKKTPAKKAAPKPKNKAERKPKNKSA